MKWLQKQSMQMQSSLEGRSRFLAGSEVRVIHTQELPSLWTTEFVVFISKSCLTAVNKYLAYNQYYSQAHRWQCQWSLKTTFGMVAPCLWNNNYLTVQVPWATSALWTLYWNYPWTTLALAASSQIWNVSGIRTALDLLPHTNPSLDLEKTFPDIQELFHCSLRHSPKGT